MLSLRKMKSVTVLKTIILLKVAAAGTLFLLQDGGFYIGDKPLAASTENNTTIEPEKEVDGRKETQNLAQNTAPNSPQNGATEGKTRKSFLSNLLELPSLDPEPLRKDEIGKYLEIAERKRQQIEERLETLKRREAQLQGLEKSIDDKLRLLDEERRFFAQTIQKEKDLKGERLDKIVTMYAKMEPKKAAPVFEKLDKDLVVDLFKRLPQKQITAILETMDPDKSVEISEYYGRVRSAREYDLLKEMNQSLRKEFDECKGLPTALAE